MCVENDECRWNNASGTYKCFDSLAFQADLPLDKFYAVVQDSSLLETLETTRHELGQSPEGFLHITDQDLWLQKVLKQSDAVFHAAQTQWAVYRKVLIDDNMEASECRDKLMAMISERSISVKKYGYGFEVQADIG